MKVSATEETLKPSDVDTKIGEHRKAWAEVEEKKRSCLKQILRPILVCMALSGCYNFSDLNYIAKNEDKKVTAKYVFSVVYRIMVLLVVIAVAAKLTVTTINKPEYKLMGILCIAWTLMLLSFMILSFKQHSRKFGHYEQAFKLWEEKIVPAGKELGIPCPVARMKHRTLVVSFVAVVFVVLNTVGVGIQMMLVPGDFFVYPFEDTAWSHAEVSVAYFLASAVWLVPQANAVVVCSSVTYVFKSFNKFLEENICQKSKPFPPNFKKMRHLHLNLCKLVEELDNDMGWFFAADFVFSIFLTLFAVYQMIKTSLDTVSLVLYGFWFLAGIVILIVTAAFSAQTNVAVRLRRLCYM